MESSKIQSLLREKQILIDNRERWKLVKREETPQEVIIPNDITTEVSEPKKIKEPIIVPEKTKEIKIEESKEIISDVSNDIETTDDIYV